MMGTLKFTSSGILLWLVCVHAKETEVVNGFVNDSVTLQTGITGEWNLSIVQWSIWTNKTYIATFIDNNKIFGEQWLFSGRLHLDPTTGFLRIDKLRTEDSMTYDVYVKSTENNQHNNKIHLKVFERVSKPRVTVKEKMFKNGSCHIILECSTQNSHGIKFTWELEPVNDTCIEKKINTNATSSVLKAIITPNRKVVYKCIVDNNVSNNSFTSADEMCSIDKEHVCVGYSSTEFGFGIFITLIIGFIIGCFKEKIVTFLPCREKQDDSRQVPTSASEGQVNGQAPSAVAGNEGTTLNPL